MPHPPSLRSQSLALGLAAVLLAGLLLGLGSCTDDVGTSIRVSLVYKDSWHIGSADVLASGGEERAPIAREILLLLPDSAAGEVMPLEVWGVRDGERIAHGDAVALPRKGATVGATIVLERLPCGVFCEVGELQCDGGGTSTCIVDGDDCLAWSEPAACPAATPFCTAGECRVDCDDECADGESTCVDASTERRCGQFDADTCRDFSANVACAAGQACYGGRCAAACTYEATVASSARLPATTDGGARPTVVASPAGGLYAIYSAPTTSQLMLLRKPRGGAWSAPEMIGATGESPSLALGKDGRLHVSFFAAGLHYGARATNGTWTFKSVEPGGEIGASSAIALDDDGVVHIVYQDTAGAAPSLLRHAFGDGTAFTLETADTQLGYRCDLAISGKTLHVISYSDTNNVWYSTKGATGGWAVSVKVEDLDDEQLSPIARSSIVVDRAGTIHVAYTDAYNEFGFVTDWLQYSSRAMAGAWRTPVSIDRGAASGERTGGMPELAVDLFDGVHVAYRTTGATPSLQYAYRGAAASAWQLVATPNSPSLEPSLAVDSSNSVLILSSARPGALIESTRACQ